MTDHVIYRYDPGNHPEITYRAVPSGCAGGADTLADARASYRAAMSERSHVDRHDLPRVVEHLEGLVAGMWTRTKMGAVHRDPISDRMFLQIVLSPGRAQSELRTELERLTEMGAEPVMVIAEGDERVESVLDQMTPRDALVIAYPCGEPSVGWIAVYGTESPGAQGVPEIVESEALRETRIATFTDAHSTDRGLVVRRQRPAAMASRQAS